MADHAFAGAVVEWLQPRHASSDVVAGVAIFTPVNRDACELRVEYLPEHELLTMYLGVERIPVELSLAGQIVPENVRPWVTDRAEAVFAGRYEQERTTLHDGALVAVSGTFHLDTGDVCHVYRPASRGCGRSSARASRSRRTSRTPPSGGERRRHGEAP